MELVRWEPVRPAPDDDVMFTGSVERKVPTQEQKTFFGRMRAGWVRFEAGARTNWHTHDGEQLLYIIAGRGCVADTDKTIKVGPGDVVHIPVGARHWHGAEGGEDLLHIAVTGGSQSDWPRPPQVPDPCT